jgi:hypothetical protein
VGASAAPRSDGQGAFLIGCNTVSSSSSSYSISIYTCSLHYIIYSTLSYKQQDLPTVYIFTPYLPSYLHTTDRRSALEDSTVQHSI